MILNIFKHMTCFKLHNFRFKFKLAHSSGPLLLALLPARFVCRFGNVVDGLLRLLEAGQLGGEQHRLGPARVRAELLQVEVGDAAHFLRGGRATLFARLPEVGQVEARGAVQDVRVHGHHFVSAKCT